MTYVKKIVISCISLVCINISHADTSIASAIAASLTTQTVNTGSMVYMKNHGMNPQYVSTPNGGYVVPGSAAKEPQAAPAGQASEQPAPYSAQNQQQNKAQFAGGNNEQAFALVQPTLTAQPATQPQPSFRPGPQRTRPGVAGQPITAAPTQPGVVNQSVTAPAQPSVAHPSATIMSGEDAEDELPPIPAQLQAKNQTSATTPALSPIMITQQAQ